MKWRYKMDTVTYLNSDVVLLVSEQYACKGLPR